MKYPLIGLCIALCLGIGVAAYLKIPLFTLYILAFLFLIFSIIFIKQNKKFQILILCTIFFLGACLLRNSQILPEDHIARFTPYKSETVYLVGTINNDPVYKENSVSFILKTEKLKTGKMWQRVSGKVLVKIFRIDDFFYGDRLLLEGSLYRPPSLKGFNYRSYLKHHDIYSILSVKKKNIIKKLGKEISNPLKFFAFRVRHKMGQLINKNLSVFSSNILNAIILGQRQNLPSHIRDALIKSGSVHILAISGLHLGIVAFIILAILKIARIPIKLQYILTIFLLIIYCILTGARIPVVRATLMAIILLFGYFFQRQVNIYNSLSLAALIILAVNPWQLFEVSFQLSFLSVISIVYFTPKIKTVFPARLYKIKWLHFLIIGFSISAAAWLGLLPLIAYYFKIIAPVTLLANMIIVPYMSVIIASGFALILVSVLMPPLAPIFAESCQFFILLLFKINSLLISIPGAYFKLPKLHIGYMLPYYCFLVFIFGFYKKQKVL